MTDQKAKAEVSQASPTSSAWGRLTANQQGALWLLAAASGFTVTGMLVKLLAQGGMSPFQIGFARAVIAFFVILPFAWRAGPAVFRTQHPWIHVARGVFGSTAMLCGFYALAHLPLADVTALGFTQPLFTTALAALLLGESVRWRRWSATLVGFLGVLIMVRPGASGFEWASVVALGMALGITLAVILVKRLPAGESQISMLFYFALASIIVSLVPALLAWREPTPLEWLLLAGVGILGLISQAMIIRAYRIGEASFVAPFDYSKLLLATAIGFFVFGELPDRWAILGAAIIVASTLYIAHREARRREVRPAPPPPSA